MKSRTSEHILNTSADLLGISLFVITAVQVSSHRELTIIDELTAMMSMFFALASILSFLSIRSNSVTTTERLERIAEYVFMIGLIGIAGVILLIVTNFVR